MWPAPGSLSGSSRPILTMVAHQSSFPFAGGILHCTEKSRNDTALYRRATFCSAMFSLMDGPAICSKAFYVPLKFFFYPLKLHVIYTETKPKNLETKDQEVLASFCVFPSSGGLCLPWNLASDLSSSDSKAGQYCYARTWGSWVIV